MSGRAKRVCYRVADFALWALLCFGAWFLPFFLRARSGPLALSDELFYAAALLLSTFDFPVLLHECGHLLAGALGGMKLARFRVPIFGRHAAAGETAMYPKTGERVRGKFLAFTLGGAALNLTVGLALFLLWLLLPYRPVLLLCGTLSGSVFFEGVRALLPAELPAGKTDGAVLLGLLRGRSEEDIALRVLAAQGILYRGRYSDVPRELLFGAPVVREDLPAYRALLMLRTQYLLARGEEEGAKGEFSRLSELEDYFSDEEEREFGRYVDFFSGKFEAEPSPFFGVAELERELAERTEKKL